MMANLTPKQKEILGKIEDGWSLEYNYCFYLCKGDDYLEVSTRTANALIDAGVLEPHYPVLASEPVTHSLVRKEQSEEGKTQC